MTDGDGQLVDVVHGASAVFLRHLAARAGGVHAPTQVGEAVVELADIVLGEPGQVEDRLAVQMRRYLRRASQPRRPVVKANSGQVSDGSRANSPS